MSFNRSWWVGLSVMVHVPFHSRNSYGYRLVLPGQYRAGHSTANVAPVAYLSLTFPCDTWGMQEEAALLKAIADQPDDDNNRTVYADWLDEYGDDPTRAELIRLQCGLQRGRDWREPEIELTAERQKELGGTLRRPARCRPIFRAPKASLVQTGKPPTSAVLDFAPPLQPFPLSG